MKKFPLLKTKVNFPEITSKINNGSSRLVRVNTHGMAELSHDYGINIEAMIVEQLNREIERVLRNLNNNEI